ncbi:MAG: 3-phosphoglycerate dehydrogenase [Ruminococcaceae bacterium]|nr:3-phosphoglycerate dehydrogenase [Oscillospiraceae bacterium]
MKNIKLFNKIAACGLNRLGDDYNAKEELKSYEGILVRSAQLIEEKFPSELLAIARAGAGVNNIPVDRCTEEGICVFNTPGANANGVKELAVLCLLLASRDVVGAIDWAKTLEGNADAAKLVEKGKSAFAGCEIKGKTLSIIGLGAIGGMLANAAIALGMDVIGYDPWLSVPAALKLDARVQITADLDVLFSKADYLSIHVPSTPDTKGMINASAIAKMKDQVKILNLARADLVNSADVVSALEQGKIKVYITDFPNADVIGKKGVIAIPHLGASTEEAEDNCAIMAADQLKGFIENGNVVNSVNFPALSMARCAAERLTVLYKDGTDLSAFTAKAVAAVSAQRKGIGYAILDLADSADALKNELEKLDGVIRVFRF